MREDGHTDKEPLFNDAADEVDAEDIKGYDTAIGWEPEYKYQKLIDDHRKKHPPLRAYGNLLDVRPANDWMEETPDDCVSTKLFGDLWKEGELAIMFADTGTGKSILGVQIAEAIARGVPALSSPPGLGGVAAASADGVVVLENSSPPQRVLYLDFEMSSAQFSERYSRRSADGLSYTDKYEFSPNMLRSEIRWEGDLPEAFKTVGEFMSYSLCDKLREQDPTVLIVDNISYLSTANVNADSALTLMRALKAIKSDYRISILVLAHTPKRIIARPLTVNDLAGSKMLANFADHMFAIGTSTRDRGIRYIKQIKPRMSVMKYDESNVIVCRLEKPHNFPQFTFVGFDRERVHTTRPDAVPAADRQKLIAAAHVLANDGHTQREIAEILRVGKGTVGRYLSEEKPRPVSKMVRS